MAMRFWSALALVALFVSAFTGSASLAKPPDLPIDLRVRCPNAQETPPQGSFDLDLSPVVFPSEKPGATNRFPCLDAFVPAMIQRLCLDWLQGGQGRRSCAASAREEDDRREGNFCRETRTDRAPEICQTRLAQAREMFQIAERCRQRGDLGKARTCYQEAHLLCPESRYGRQAIQRLAEIDAARLNQEPEAGAEEQEPPPDRSSQLDNPQRDNSEEIRRQNMLRETQPLGLVPFNFISTRE